MANANIFAAYARPVKSVNDYLGEYESRDMRREQLSAQRRQNALAELTAQQQQEAMQQNAIERAAMQRFAGETGDPEQLIQRYRGSGLPGLVDRAGTMQKGLDEQAKTRAEVTSKKAEVFKKAFEAVRESAGFVFANPTPEAARAALGRMKMISSELGIPNDFSADEAAIAQFRSPEDFKRWAAGHAMRADQLLPKLQNFTAGGHQVNQAVDLVTGRIAETGRTEITQSADNRASTAASVENNKRSVGAAYANAAAAREQANATRDAARIQTGFANEQSLRKEFEGLGEVKNYKQAYPAYAAVKDAASRNTTQSDINLVYGIAKLYDPTSVVREGEYATVANSPNIPERIKGFAQYLAGGGRLSPEVKKQIVSEAEGRIQSYRSEVDKAKRSYEGIASKRGMDPNSVFADMGDVTTGGGGNLSADEAKELEALRKRFGKGQGGK